MGLRQTQPDPFDWFKDKKINQVITVKIISSDNKGLVVRPEECEMDFVIKHGYMANCGGCYSVLFFKTDQEFRYLGELFYDPGKYGGTAHYDEYDANKQKIQEYKK